MDKKNIQILEKLADSLSKYGVKFHFLDKRWKRRGDVDVSVAEDSLKKFDQVAQEHDFLPGKSWHPKYRFYCRFSNGELLKIHVQIGRYEGLPEGLLEPGKASEPHEYFLPVEEQIFYFVYRMALREPLHKYEDCLSELVQEKIDEDKLHKYFTRVFKNPKELLTKIMDAKFSDLDPKFKFSHKLPRAKRYILNKGVELVKRICERSPPHIVVIGPDGSGKTTTLDAISKMLQKYGVSYARTTGGRFRFKVLPMDRASEKIEERYFGEDEDDISHHARRYPTSPFQIIVPFVFYLEYLLRYLLHIRTLAGKSQVVISDRSFIDVIASPNAFTLVSKALYSLLPKPDAVIYLFNNPDVLAKRRPEHPRHDLERQLEAYDSLTEHFTCRIETTEKEKVEKKVFTIILQEI